MTTKQATYAAPVGSSGLVVAPWSPSEPYGVAANWANAAAPIYTLGEDGWLPNGRQVADYCHSPAAALADELGAAIIAGGDEVDDDEVAGLVDNATEF